MVKIGKECLFAANVNFITHDGAVKVLNSLHVFGGELDKVGLIVVGNNVYIGMGAYMRKMRTLFNEFLHFLGICSFAV